MATTLDRTAAKDWVDRLTPAQYRVLDNFARDDSRMPEIGDTAPGVVEYRESDLSGFLAMAGSIDSGETDRAVNHDRYIREHLSRKFGCEF